MSDKLAPYPFCVDDEEQYIAHINEVLAAQFPPLLSCPFCGGEATYTGHVVNAFLVRCTKCGCMTPSYGDELTDRKKSIMQARDTWNRRVGDE